MQKRMRWLRMKYNISLLELERCSDVNNQRISQIELGHTKATPHMNDLVETMFSRLIQIRRQELNALEADFARYRKNLLDIIDEQEGDK